MKKMKRMAALILSCALAAVCPVMGSQAEENTRKDFVFGDYVGDVDPASGAYAWVGMRIGVMESLFKLDDSMTVQKIWSMTIPFLMTGWYGRLSCVIMYSFRAAIQWMQMR